MLKTYLKEICAVASRGDSTEPSYYEALKALLTAYLESAGLKEASLTSLPKKTEAGNPDFRVWDGQARVTGYIEAKAPQIEDLDRVEESEQLRRYRKTFPNLILTNFFEFRLYRNGERILKTQICRPFIIQQMRRVPPAENEAAFTNLLERFFSFSLPAITSAQILAEELAKRTRFLKDDILAQELKVDTPAGVGEGERSDYQYGRTLEGFYEAFQEYLISDLTRAEFVDLYSQTITYGLFAARTRTRGGGAFNRRNAYDSIPHTIGILRDVFRFISLEDLPKQMEWTVDDIAEVLAVTDVQKILSEYFKQGRGKDPVVHFYETFLAEYAPEVRERRGVYYTPEPVVSYIVRSLHLILKEHFGRPDGFADTGLTVLDPAAGTLTFPAEAAKLAVEEFKGKYGTGNRERLIREHILKNFYAFELMMAPYAIGHIKISFLLEELGYALKGDDRFNLYLTNTLEMEEIHATNLPGMASLSEESEAAGKVKKQIPILVIMGNPPYSGHSSNKYEEVKEYYQVDGKPLKEKNPKWLQDDYVKFIRFSQWKIDQAGEGVLGFITNHGYLDNPTFRGMRQSLLKSFDEIYLLDLHGNSKKKETSPDGSKDENVFDNQQGVAIGLFIKKKGDGVKGDAKVYHADLYGRREEKYRWLEEKDIHTTDWRQLTPHSETYFFMPRDEKLLGRYEKHPKIPDIFLVNSVGIVTARDNLTIQWTPEQIRKIIMLFPRMDSESARTTYQLGKDARDWKVELAQRDLLESGMDNSRIQPILYRPFDIRYTYYTGKSRGFLCMPRPEVMRHMLRENLGLITRRQMLPNHPCNYVFISNKLISDGVIRSDNKGSESLFPLYLYPEKGEPHIFSSTDSQKEREPNLNSAIVGRLSETYGRQPLPEEVLYYVYAVLYAPAYRSRYAEFLKSDFPRIPFTGNLEVFQRAAALGKCLVDLHLLNSVELDQPVSQFPVNGGNRVEKVRYEKGRVYINTDQYFEKVRPEVWEYQVGGYQVCSKWLKDRKGRVLSLDDVRHYCRVVTSLAKTIARQKEIDALYPEIEAETIDF